MNLDFGLIPRQMVTFLIAYGIGLFLFASGKTAQAGATSSQWVVAVNGQSLNSKTVANYFIQFRNIPACNVIVLDKVPDREKIDIDEFRDLILNPLLQEIEKRGLQRHIQGIAYSADFPTAIDLSKDLANLKDRPYFLTPVGSLNGLTYLYRFCLAKDPNLLAFGSNLYGATTCDRLFTQPFGGDLAKNWTDVQTLVKNGEHEKAANSLRDLFEKHPRQFPVAYQAATQFALADKTDLALEMLEKAIGAGWTFRDKMASEPAFEKLKGNNRFSLFLDSCELNDFDFWPTQAFNARAFWSPNGVANAQPDEGVSYMLSIVLAVTRGNGTTLEQAVEQLRVAAQADYSHPEGEFYFTKTADVRTTCREPGFTTAIDRLTKLSHQGIVVPSVMPKGKKNCLGVTMGSATFSWASSQSHLTPGAIAENLTSLGGVMETGAGQTKLTEFLLHGAAASSGAVTEPYSIQAKFPHPMIHAYYADGLTLAEAYYSSVTGPYQLLIVGDPLCQPFGHPHQFSIAGLKEGQTVDKKLKFQLESQVIEDKRFGIASLEMLIDGQLRSASMYANSFDLNLTNPVPGAHDLALIATDDSQAQCKWEQRVTFVCGDDDAQVRIVANDIAENGSSIKIHLSGPDNCERIELRHNSLAIAEISTKEGDLEITAEQVGYGPVRLIAVGTCGSQQVASLPIRIEFPLPKSK